MPNPKDENKEPETKDEGKEPETRDEGADESGEREVQPVPDIAGQIAPVLDSIAALNAEIESIKTAVSALANAGAVNASVNEDNGGDPEDYPTIDLDEVNRLIGA